MSNGDAMKTTDEKMREAFETLFKYPMSDDAESETFARGWQAALSQPAEGWKLVPVEPTQEMWDAACAKYSGTCGFYSEIYRAMLAAVPTPPQEQPNAARLPNSAVVTNVYEAYEEGRRAQEQPEAVEPVGEVVEVQCADDDYAVEVKLHRKLPPGTKLFGLSPDASQALKRAAKMLRTFGAHITPQHCALSIEALIPPTESEGELRWSTGGRAYGKPTATDALEYAEQRIAQEGIDAYVDDVRIKQMPNVCALITTALESDQRKQGFAEGVKAAAAHLKQIWKPMHDWDRYAAEELLKLTPPTDTVTMTREKLRSLAIDAFSHAAALAYKNELATKTGAECDDICRAIVAQHMPEESK